jgi:hypothetical protein
MRTWENSILHININYIICENAGWNFLTDDKGQ